jgi:hypothetical protein
MIDLGERMKHHVHGRFCVQVCDQVYDTVCDQVYNHVYDIVRSPVNNLVWTPVWNDMNDQLKEML